MFDNPILFASVTGLIVTLVYFFVNKERDKKDRDPGKNTKYIVVFGIVFIIGLIGKICYNGSLDEIEDRVEKILKGGSSSNDIVSEIETSAMPSTSGETPPF
mgnify:CR=1 FL=1